MPWWRSKPSQSCKFPLASWFPQAWDPGDWKRKLSLDCFNIYLTWRTTDYLPGTSQWSWKTRVWGLRGFGVLLTDHFKHGKCPKLCTYIRIDISLAGLKHDFPKKRTVLIFMTFRLVTCLIPIFDLRKPPVRKTIKRQSFMIFFFDGLHLFL